MLNFNEKSKEFLLKTVNFYYSLAGFLCLLKFAIIFLIKKANFEKQKKLKK